MGRISIGVAAAALVVGGGTVAAGTTAGVADPPGDNGRQAPCGVLTTTPETAVVPPSHGRIVEAPSGAPANRPTHADARTNAAAG